MCGLWIYVWLVCSFKLFWTFSFGRGSTSQFLPPIVFRAANIFARKSGFFREYSGLTYLAAKLVYRLLIILSVRDRENFYLGHGILQSATFFISRCNRCPEWTSKHIVIHSDCILDSIPAPVQIAGLSSTMQNRLHGQHGKFFLLVSAIMYCFTWESNVAVWIRMYLGYAENAHQGSI